MNLPATTQWVCTCGIGAMGPFVDRGNFSLHREIVRILLTLHNAGPSAGSAFRAGTLIAVRVEEHQASRRLM